MSGMSGWRKGTKGNPASRDVFVARQPIVDRDRVIRAYELLHRREGAVVAEITDGDQASIEVALNSLLDIGLDSLVGHVPAYLNATRRVLVDGLFRLFPQHRVVIEVLETVTPDEEVEEALDEARRRGYRVALDDYVPGDARARLLPKVDVVKVDAGLVSREDVAAMAATLRRSGLELLVEKVETNADFAYFKSAGYDLFQGYFYCRPEVRRSRSLDANRLALLRLLARMEDPGSTFHEVEELVRHDISLSFKLLKLVNAAVFSLQRPVESLRHGLVMLGLHRIRECVSLLLLSSFHDKPRALLLVTLQRAHLCRRLGELRGDVDAEKAFTVGLFSTLDALMDAQLEAVLAELPLSDDLKAALTRGDGLLGEVLEVARGCETGCGIGADAIGVSNEALQTAFLNAVAWAGAMDAVMPRA